MKKLILAAAATLLTSSAFAGGHLTNTNQSISFLRNPARNAAIGIDGVYSNPAGVAFLNEGFHLNLNIQSAYQTREITTTNPLFILGAQNGGNPEKFFKGTANAPVIPSIQAAYNKNNWSFQFGFGIIGGGGKCTFDNGLGSFENVIAEKAAMFGQLNGLKGLSAFGVPGVNNIPNATGYDMNSFMEGRQYYFGFTLGAGYKINEHLSVYGGVKVLYGNASYKAKISDINVMVDGTNRMSLENYVGAVSGAMTEAGAFAKDPANQQAMVMGVTQKLIAEGMDPATAAKTAKTTVATGLGKLNAAGEELANTGEALSPYLRDGVNLQSDQTGWGIAPVIGVDYQIGQFNFTGRYEFKTRMRMKNKSDVDKASVIPAINKFQDGTYVPEDQPALLALGAQWSPLSNLRIDLGWHHFFDKDGHLYMNQERALGGDTNEYLAGIEWDPIKKLTVSGGIQITRYGLSDDFMNDMSFVVNSWSFGLGAKYQINNTVAVEAAYFQTNYGDYNRTVTATKVTDKFHRTNRVFGLGATLNF